MRSSCWRLRLPARLSCERQHAQPFFEPSLATRRSNNAGVEPRLLLHMSHGQYYSRTNHRCVHVGNEPLQHTNYNSSSTISRHHHDFPYQNGHLADGTGREHC